MGDPDPNRRGHVHLLVYCGSLSARYSEYEVQEEVGKDEKKGVNIIFGCAIPFLLYNR